MAMKIQSLNPIMDQLARVKNNLGQTKAIFDEIVVPFYTNQARRNLESAGSYGGLTWDFSGEPKYGRVKSLIDPANGAKPMLTKKGIFSRTLFDPSSSGFVAVSSKDSVLVGSRHPYAKRLIENGGTGPYGESYPARDPYQTTEQQAQTLADLIAVRISSPLTTS